MTKEKIFSAEEIGELGAMSHELILAAIDSGDKEKAREMTLRLFGEAKRIHHTYLYWLTSLMSYIGRHYGDEALEDAQKEFLHVAAARGANKQQEWDAQGKEGLRQKVEDYAQLLRGHWSPLTIQEDDEKFVLQMHPCGSGGHMILNGIDEKFGFLKIKKAQPMTYGQSDLPVYCTHGACAAMAYIECGVVPGMFEEASEDPGHVPCNFYIYKDQKSFPAELYAKVGKEKKA